MPVKKAHIKGFGNKYSVDSNGKVYSNGKKMSPRLDKNGYTRINLSHKGEMKTVRVHNLVSKHFKIKGKRHQTQDGHMDGDKTNAALRNLRRQSPSENSQHAHDTGLYGRYTRVKSHLRKGKNKVSSVINHKRKK